MAKFAIVVLAALAFQAVNAGVFMNQRFLQENSLGEYKYGLEYYGYPTGKFDNLLGELQSVSQDMTMYFQRALPNDRLVLKTLTWQSRELAQYIDTIIEKLQTETYKYDGQVRMVLEQFMRELREIQMEYQQIAAYTTDVYAAGQMKNQFYMTVQRTIVQLEKWVRFVQTDLNQTHGDLYFMIKNVVADFLYAYRNIYNQMQYYGVYTEQSPMELLMQIQEVTKYLTGYLQGLTRCDAQRMYAVREYVQHVESIFTKIQGIEGSYGNNMEVSAAFQRIYSKLHRMHAYFVQMIDAEYMENVEVIRKQLIEELQFVCEAFEQFVQYAHAGGYKTFFYEILGDYLYAMQQFRMRMMHGGYQSELQGLYSDKAAYQGLYQDAGLWGKTGMYQGLYRYGGYGYRLFGKYQGLSMYGQDFKQYEMQMQTMIRDLYKTLQTVSFDDLTMKQAMKYMIREYAQRLEMIVEKMTQYMTNVAGADSYMCQEVCQNLRQYLMVLRQMCVGDYPHMEMTTQFNMCVQKIALEFQKMMYAMEQTNGQMWYLVKDILYQYMTATCDLYMHVQSMTDIAYYGYLPYARQYYGDNYRMMENINNYGMRSYAGLEGQQMYESPRELVNQIQYVATDLSATFQKGMLFNQKHAQVLTVQARHFAQIIKNIIDRLEAYEHVDAVMQQVIYKLREVQMNFQQLAAYNVFNNVEQFKTEFDNYVQIAVVQIEKLVVLCQGEAYGNLYYTMKDVLHRFLYGLKDICYQIREFAQLGQYGQQWGMGKYYYGQGYGYGKYGHEYGYDKYARGLFGLEKYGMGYQKQMGYPWAKYNQAAIRAY